MERNYDKVEQSNGGKNMRFFEYLKKQNLQKKMKKQENEFISCIN